MTFRLTVAHGLAPLADVLADELAAEPEGHVADPFVREVIAVPGDGVRAWLTDRLATRLGSTGLGDGIVANVEFLFPAHLVRRALGEQQPDGAWSVGRLTWAVHEVMHTDGAALGLQVDAVRARAIADLFDRYTLHRPAMVRQWESGRDVDALGQPLATHLAWQPALWRLLLQRLGGPSDATAMALAPGELRTGRRTPLLPGRVFLVGLASLPAPHLAVLSALAQHTDVHVLAPAPSLDVWQHVRAVAAEPLVLPIARTADPTATLTRHRLGAGWGRAAREAHLLLTNVALEGGASIAVVPEATAEFALDDPFGDTVEGEAALAVLQRHLRLDLDPPGPPPPGTDELRRPLLPTDRSLQWHRCHGLARQVEVLRDVLLRLFDERRPDGQPRFAPRDVTVLCPDPVLAAPLVEAAFAGSERDGVPAIPVRIADRSLRLDNPLLDTVGALLELLDGRFRVSDVLAFAARPPVRRRFGLGADQLGTLVEWADATHVHWGLDASSRPAFGLPPSITAHTWQACLDRLVLGAMMSDTGSVRGPGGAVPFGDVGGDDLDLVGALGDLVDALAAAHAVLSTPAPVAVWSAALVEAAASLCSLSDADSWQWRTLERVADEFATEAVGPDGEARRRKVPPAELATLLSARLRGGPGRVRFRSGAVTVSSLTAQRAVPSPVVCLIGLDGDLAAGTLGADDLTAIPPCVGDRDPRSELRAQLLDALLAAGERFVVCSTGRDVRTNAPVPPSVPIAELADLVDATFVVAPSPSDGAAGHATRASSAVAVDHPRQAWSDRNFIPGELVADGPWSFDRGAMAAADARRTQAVRPAFLAAPLPAEPLADVGLVELERALKNPIETFLQRRLGVSMPRERASVDDILRLSADPLERWKVKDDLIRARRTSAEWDDGVAAEWRAVQLSKGSVPPLGFGAAQLGDAELDADQILGVCAQLMGGCALGEPQARVVRVEIGGRVVAGEISGIHGSLAIEVTASRLRPHHRLLVWLRAAALTCAFPETQWEAAFVGHGDRKPVLVRARMRSLADARRAVAFALDLHDRALRSVLPALPDITSALRESESAARTAWGSFYGRSERSVAVAYGSYEFDDLLAEAPLADESGPGWIDDPSRLRRWSHRCWTEVDATARVGTTADEDLDVD